MNQENRSYELSSGIGISHHPEKGSNMRTKKKEAIFHSNNYFCWPVMFQTNSTYLGPLYNFLVSHLSERRWVTLFTVHLCFDIKTVWVTSRFSSHTFLIIRSASKVYCIMRGVEENYWCWYKLEFRQMTGLYVFLLLSSLRNLFSIKDWKSLSKWNLPTHENNKGLVQQSKRAPTAY